MRRIVLAAGLALALVMPLASFASASEGDGHAYGHDIKACTGLSYGQLKKAVMTGQTLPVAITFPVGWTKPSLGAKKLWEYLAALPVSCLQPAP